MSKTYQKIPGLYLREEVKPFKIIHGVFREPEIEALKDIQWEFTEKVDGTNIRVMWDGHNVTFGGRTDNAQLPATLVTKLAELFQGPINEQIFEQLWGDASVTLFGEGCGAKIQKGGGNYSKEQQFVLFDVSINDMFLFRSSIEDIANKFGVEVVPVVHIGKLQEGIDLVKDGLKSYWGDFYAEGLVAKTHIPLYTRRGERIITKIKRKDLV